MCVLKTEGKKSNDAVTVKPKKSEEKKKGKHNGEKSPVHIV